MQLDTKEALRVRALVGPALAQLHERWRGEALAEFEDAETDELRLKCQVRAKLHRDMAALWRDDQKQVRDEVLRVDSTHEPENARF
jgi:hypothetical protein